MRYLFLSFFALSLLVACSKNTDTVKTTNGSGKVNEDPADYIWDNSKVTHIVLKDNAITIDSVGATASGSKVTITSAGTYSLSGTLTNGQIIVNTTDTATVRLILNGITVTNSSSSAILVKKSGKTVICLADNTQNSVTDGSSYTVEDSDDDPNAAIFSKSDLSIFGNGSLTVNAKYNDGITSKDGLIIKSGNITVNSIDDGIRGKDYLIIRDGNFTLKTSGDGFKSDNDENTALGYISIVKGTFNITSGKDAIQAHTDVKINSGDFVITTGGGSSDGKPSSYSAKGIKAIDSLIINGGIFSINSADDAIHTNGNMLINAGTYTLSTGDDGMHANTTLAIKAGDINVNKSYEGIESAKITIDGGNIHVTSSDDGINAASGSSSGTGGMGGGMSAGNCTLYINGGYIYVNGNGDGVDVNGSITMTGGTLIVNGPTANDNGALDYDGTFKLTGGYVLAAGSSGMAQAPDATSSQNSLLLNFTSAYKAGVLVHIETSAGDEVLTFKPVKQYQSIAFSSSKLVKGTTYLVYTSGSSTGTATDGLYTGGSYTAGTKYTSFTISSVVTKLGSSSGMGGGGMGF